MSDETKELAKQPTDKSFGITKDGHGGYAVVEILYDLSSRTVGSMTVLREGLTKLEAEERFKIEVATNLFT